jgi:3-oxoacyl-[acyl-carrier protein] reductase
MSSLRDKTAVVFGASAYVGAGIAAALGRAGANVVVHYRGNQAAAVAVVEDIERSGARAVPLRADMTEEDSIRELYAAAVDRFGSVDCMVNSAHGPFEPQFVADQSWDTDWRVHLDALKGHVLACKAVLPIMRGQGSGRIVFISGGLSHRLFEGFSAFSTVKAGLNAFSRTLAIEEGRHGITVNIVAPGKVAAEVPTAINSEAWDDIERRQRVAAPLGRYASVEDVADAVLYFLSPGAAGITGQTLYVAAGEVM